MSVEHYENFPVASWLCPPHLRGAVRAIYHFARCADDIADEGDAAADERLRDLAAYRAALARALGVEPLEPLLASAAPSFSRHGWAAIFADLRAAARRHELPARPLHDLLDAFEQDARNPPYADRAALLDYCSRSANPVGRLLLHLYGIDDAVSLRRCDAVCSALQLINFWQDLSVDLPRGRCYVSASDLSRHALSRDDLRAGDTPASRALVADLVSWSRRLMLEGAPLALTVPGRAGWELRLVVQGGLRILDKIDAARHNVLAWRPRVVAGDAPLLAWRALRMRGHAAAPSRAHDLVP